MKVFTSLLLLCFLLSSTPFSAQQKKMSKELSLKIQQDERIATVEKMAEDLIEKGLTAGDGYSEVWIRDLNTFIETGCYVGDKQKLKDALITFFKFQGKDGNIVDGYTAKVPVLEEYRFIYSEYEPNLMAHKNTVETDHETSMVQTIYKYIQATKDTSILNEKINGRTVKERMGDAMHFLLNERYSSKYGLIWGATTADWGDVQPEHGWGVTLDSNSHLAIDIYDNAMFIIALNNLSEMLDNKSEAAFWTAKSKEISKNARKYLWDKKKQKFIPHIYLDGSPFPAGFDEDAIYYHGGTTIAIEADLLSKKEIRAAYKRMLQNVKAANAQTIGLTMYPPYPNGYFENKVMGEYYYQNGGDWTWFGARTVQQLIRYGMYEEAYSAISPMLDRVIKHKGFYEWWTPAGVPSGSSSFRGSAGVLWKSIQMFKEQMPKM